MDEEESVRREAEKRTEWEGRVRRMGKGGNHEENWERKTGEGDE